MKNNYDECENQYLTEEEWLQRESTRRRYFVERYPRDLKKCNCLSVQIEVCGKKPSKKS